MKMVCKRQDLKEEVKIISSMLAIAKQRTQHRARQLVTPPIHGNSGELYSTTHHDNSASAPLEFTLNWMNDFEHSIRQYRTWCSDSEVLLPQEQCDILGDFIACHVHEQPHH